MTKQQISVVQVEIADIRSAKDVKMTPVGAVVHRLEDNA
jgi:hypothetical protein